MEQKVIFIPYEQFVCAKVLISKRNDGSTKQLIIDQAERVGYKKLTEEPEGEYFSPIAIEFNSMGELIAFKESIRSYCLY